MCHKKNKRRKIKINKKKVSKEDTLKKWDSILDNTGCSQDFGSLLPIAMKVTIQTIAQDLVPVQPMDGGNSRKEMEKIRSDIKIENRDRKIDSLVEGKDFEEMKKEDHPDYIKPKGPSSQLFYIDFVYGATNSTI
jgi:hypothetical protein